MHSTGAVGPLGICRFPQITATASCSERAVSRPMIVKWRPEQGKGLTLVYKQRLHPLRTPHRASRTAAASMSRKLGLGYRFLSLLQIQAGWCPPHTSPAADGEGGGWSELKSAQRGLLFNRNKPWQPLCAPTADHASHHTLSLQRHHRYLLIQISKCISLNSPERPPHHRGSDNC